ncbi:hypothetical protein FRX31_002252 [Thalictrum thalictroides]|uniref:DUF4283 domain-containing protein n=1 Tax=Thalictrum thalictroides TaxID=46969 RepID=A0A7J6XHK6_THATH|nr:hypothetical protein FRX31_002252 [Thalictrum thalictroides]
MAFVGLGYFLHGVFLRSSHLLKKARDVEAAILRNNEDLVLRYKSVINDDLKLELDHALALEKVVLPPASFRSFKKDGKPAFSFSKEDLERGQLLVSAHSVVLKFSAECPSLGIIRAGIQKNWNVNGNFNLGLLDDRHVLYPGFNLKKDLVRAPVLVDLPNLPLEFFNPAFLEVLGNGLGSFVAVDRDTRAFTKPDVARMCVEMNVDGDLHEAVWIEGHNYAGLWQPLFYPNFLYCSHCSKIGHSFENCRKRKANNVDKGKGKEGGTTTTANPTTTMNTAPKITHQNGPVYKATGNLFGSIPSGNLDINTTSENPTQGNKNAGNTQPHTALMLSNVFDVLIEANTDNSSVIQPASIETTQGHNSETAKEDAHISPSRNLSPQPQNTFTPIAQLEKGAVDAPNDNNQVSSTSSPCDTRGTTSTIPSSSSSLLLGETSKNTKPPSDLSPSHLTPLPTPLSGGGMKGSDSNFLIPDYHNAAYNEDFPPLSKNFDFEEGDLQEDNPLTPSYGSDPESYRKKINRSGFTAKKLSSRAPALDRVP